MSLSQLTTSAVATCVSIEQFMSRGAVCKEKAMVNGMFVAYNKKCTDVATASMVCRERCELIVGS